MRIKLKLKVLFKWIASFPKPLNVCVYNDFGVLGYDRKLCYTTFRGLVLTFLYHQFNIYILFFDILLLLCETESVSVCVCRHLIYTSPLSV